MWFKLNKKSRHVLIYNFSFFLPHLILPLLIISADSLLHGRVLLDDRLVITAGNSITQGYIEDELDTLNRYSTILEEYLREDNNQWQVINEANGGENSLQALSRFEEDILIRKPNYVTIAYGSNDYWVGGDGDISVPIEEFKEALSLLSSSVYLNHAIPILLSLPPLIVSRLATQVDTMRFVPFGGVNYLHNLYNEAITEVAGRDSIPFVDLEIAFQESLEVALGSDGHHPSPMGHRIIARELFLKINSLESQEIPDNGETLGGEDKGVIRDFICYPNPFIQGERFYLWIRYTLTRNGYISLEVFDISGRRLSRIHDGVRRSEGEHLTYWNGRDSRGEETASGVYLLNIHYKSGNGHHENLVIKFAVIK